jgi:excisionase family DNA binding protein
MTEKILLTVPEFMEATSLGRTMVYQLIGNGALESVTVGRRRMIPTAALNDWVARLRRKCSGQV